MKKIFLIGYYGYENLGDDLLLYEIVHRLKINEGYEISALSFDAKKISTLYGIKGVSRLKSMSIVRHIMDMDIVVCGGGSILQDKTSSRSLYYYLGILFLAKLFGKKIYLLGNGYGPIDKGFNQVLVSMMLKFVDGVVARDEESYQAYRRLGVKKLHSGADCVFLGELGRENLTKKEIFEEYKRRNHLEKPYVLFTIRPWEGMEKLALQIEQCIDILKKKGYDICFLSMKLPEDERVYRTYFEKYDVILLEREHEILPLLFSEAEFTVGMRLHGMILSAMYYTPFIAIPYDPKVESFVKQCNQLSTSRVESLKEGELPKLIDNMILEHEKFSGLLKGNIPQLQKRAQEGFGLFLKWIS